MEPDKHKNGTNASERIAKRMARAGLCSRRDAERWILAGRVTVNEQVLDSPACVVTDRDDIRVDGKPLPKQSGTRLFLYHKPVGLVTTHKDEKNRSTVFDQLPKHLPRVISVGRLDLNTEGLLLLTNDGGLARYLELPSTGWSRRYRVRVQGKVDETQLKSLQEGITVEGIRYKSIDATLERKTGTNSWLTVVLREGKNREIRKVMEYMNLQVNRLIRTSYGPFNLGVLSKNEVAEVKTDILKHQVAKYFKTQTES